MDVKAILNEVYIGVFHEETVKDQISKDVISWKGKRP
jgi:hypothetical protein